jgi:streptogramin lyase
MRESSNLNRRKFLTRAAVGGLGLSVIPSMVSSGYKSESQEAAAEPKPANWGLVTFYSVDPAWPQLPENISKGDSPALDIDSKGNIWVLQRKAPCIHQYDGSGKLIQAWGTEGKAVKDVSDGPVDLTFEVPNPQIHQIKIDNEGNVWIVTWRLGVIYKCTPEGKVLQVLGKYKEIGTDQEHFGEPNDIVITKTGDMFVADGERNFRIVHLDKNGKYIKEWGRQGKGPGEFEVPHAIGVDSKGILYVADRGNSRIQVFDQEGKFLDQWPNMIVPYDLWVDDQDFIWVCGYGPLRVKIDYHLPQTRDELIMKFDRNGKCVMNWTFINGPKPGELNTVHGIAVDSQGNVYTGEHGGRAQKFVLQKS